MSLKEEVQRQINEWFAGMQTTNKSITIEDYQYLVLPRAIRSLIEEVSSEVGIRYLEKLSETIAKNFKLSYVFVCENIDGLPVKVRIVAFSRNYRKYSNFLTYEVKGGPCEKSFRGVSVHIPRDIQNVFPEDHILIDLRAESYCSIPLLDSHQKQIGHLAIIDTKPMEENISESPILAIFAARAAQELDRIRQEKMLLEEKERLAITLQSIGDGVIVTNEKNQVVLMNKIAEKLTGWEQGNALHRDVKEIFNTSSGSKQHVVEEVMKCGSIIKSEGLQLIDKIGKKHTITNVSSPICLKDGSLTGTIQVFRDITEREATQEELIKIDRLESLGRLAGGIAHDFNNILTGIMGNVSIAMFLLKNPEESKQDLLQVLKNAEKASERAKELTQELLTFSQGGKPFRQALDTKELLKTTLSVICHGSKIQCSLDIESDLEFIYADKNQIRQVLQNLLINAEQAMGQDGKIMVNAKNICIEKHPSLRDGDYIQITVSDYGVGIADEYILKIFDPFFTTKENGTGLGLAISYSIIHHHGGSITVKSEINKGTTFCIDLPIAKNTQNRQSRPEKKGTKSTILLKRKHHGNILVMDDEDMVLDIAKKALEYSAYNVTTAKDGSEAKYLFEQAKNAGKGFDIVILDLTVPGGIGGEETMSMLQNIDSTVRAIASSGYSDNPIMSNYEKYGFIGVLPKPYSVQEIIEVVQDFLPTKSLR